MFEIIQILSVVVFVSYGIYWWTLWRVQRKYGIRFKGIPGTFINATTKQIREEHAKHKPESMIAKHLYWLLMLNIVTQWSWYICIVVLLIYALPPLLG